MNATVGHAYPSWAPTVAVIVGGDSAARRHAAALLEPAGFGVWMSRPDDELHACLPEESGALIVLLSHASASARLRSLRAVAGANPDAQIVAAMPTDAPNAALRRALLAGAAGIVLDEGIDRALVPTARAVLAGQLAVPSALTRQIAPRPLSYREKQILGLVVLGFTNREIADKLYLAESTVKTHLSSSFAKLDARSRSEAAARILDPEGGYGVGILAIAGDGAAAPAH